MQHIVLVKNPKFHLTTILISISNCRYVTPCRATKQLTGGLLFDIEIRGRSRSYQSNGQRNVI